MDLYQIKIDPARIESSGHLTKLYIILEDFGRFLKKLADNQCSSMTKGSIYHIKHMSNTTFYHGSGLTWNCMFNGSIYHVLYLHILCLYLVQQSLLIGLTFEPYYSCEINIFFKGVVHQRSWASDSAAKQMYQQN